MQLWRAMIKFPLPPKTTQPRSQTFHLPVKKPQSKNLQKDQRDAGHLQDKSVGKLNPANEPQEVQIHIQRKGQPQNSNDYHIAARREGSGSIGLTRTKPVRGGWSKCAPNSRLRRGQKLNEGWKQ